MGMDEVLSRYVETCREVADDYIERSTRFGVTDMEVLEALPEIRRFKTRIRHSLEVISDATDVQGVSKPGADDFSTLDWALYQEVVEKQAQSELARSETLDDLVAAVKAKPYAAISTRTRVRSHPRRLFHTYTCGTCHGSGRVTCHNCSGSGTVSCTGCGGSGRVSCGSCRGSGSVSQTHQVRDYSGHYHSETRYIPCHSCSGGRARCGRCGGSGRNTCKTCGGSGQVVCSTCAGHGYLTKITTTTTYTVPCFHAFYPEETPDYVHAALRKAGFANLTQYGFVEFDNVEVTREHAQADFSYRTAINFCELSLEISGHPSAWVLYGSPPQIFDTGGILEVLLKEDFARLDIIGSGWSRLLPWFHRKARLVVAPFMESEVHQQIVAADAQGFAPTAIVDKVNRSLSAEYIERSLIRLRQTVQAIARWSSLKWALTIAISSVILIVAGVTAIEVSKAHAMFAAQDRLVLFPWISGPNVSWVIAATTLPLSLAGWVLAKWRSKGWFRRAGGMPLAEWADKKGLLLGRWTAVLTIVATGMASAAFFGKWPMWIDRDGRLYGTVAVFQPPRIVEPTAYQPMQATNPHAPHNVKRKH